MKKSVRFIFNIHVSLCGYITDCLHRRWLSNSVHAPHKTNILTLLRLWWNKYENNSKTLDMLKKKMMNKNYRYAFYVSTIAIILDETIFS